MTDLAQNFAQVRSNIEAAAQRAHRDPQDIKLIAVSKTVSCETVLLAMNEGQMLFGENRVPEIEKKQQGCPGANFHLIGTLQTNKVNKVVGKVELIHSVDSLHLLEAINKRATNLGVIQHVLLQVNVAGEESKHGFTPQEMPAVLDAIKSMQGVFVNGLMTMAPHTDADKVRWVFRDLRNLCGSLQKYADEQGIAQVQLNELSMGMSNDYEIAVEEGATYVRVGTSLFGPRDYRDKQ